MTGMPETPWIARVVTSALLMVLPSRRCVASSPFSDAKELA